jgi:hypothetical protein
LFAERLGFTMPISTVNVICTFELVLIPVKFLVATTPFAAYVVPNELIVFDATFVIE